MLFIDAIHYSVRDNGVIRKLAAYVIFGMNLDGRKEVLTIQVGENERSKCWFSVLNELKNRGVTDILILCADGLTGIKDAIAAAFPKTEYQRCILYQVRNTLKYVSDFTEFNGSEPEEQKGNYMPVKLKITGKKMTLKKNGTAGPDKQNMDFDPELLFRVGEKTDTFTVEVDGREIITLNFANAELKAE